MTASSPEETEELSLRLEEYNDIFSDFDFRSYSKRAISVDFLDEMKRAVSDRNDGEIEIFLYVPEKDREESKELVIKERLAAHFKRHFHLLSIEKKHVIRTGVVMIIMGIISMAAATYILHHEELAESVISSFLVVFFEPAAWFLWWEGLDQIVFTSKKVNPSLNFYRKMANAHKNIHFKSY